MSCNVEGREVMEERNLFHVIEPPGHLFGFSARTLRAALERARFQDVELERDPMHRRWDPEMSSYWVEREPAKDAAQYFRQF